jgi:guanylate kinase
MFKALAILSASYYYLSTCPNTFDNAINKLMSSSLAAKLATYQPSAATVKLIKSTPILLLVGPTGAGKDSLKDRLLETDKYHHIISHTTRPPRINHGVIEQDGREYHFIDQATAEKMLNEQSFVEAKIYSGNLYGTSAAEIRAAHDEGRIAMTDIEVQGVAEYKTLDPHVIAMFLLPPDFKTWQARLHRRYGDIVDATDYHRRLQTALEEIEQLLNTDYYVALINDDLDATLQTIQEIAADKGKYNDTAARAIATQLAHDIQAYLDRTT